MAKLASFTIRVYGLLFNDKQEVLVSDEWIEQKLYTKFPGGGLELGESTKAAVIREFMEETEQHIEVVSHFYTTDFLIRSTFYPSKQVICIYYIVKLSQKFTLTTVSHANYGRTEGPNEILGFRWVPLSKLTSEAVSFESDKRVVGLLQQSAI